MVALQGAITWDEVEAKSEYQKLDARDKILAGREYFNTVVAPKVPEQSRQAAWNEFYNDALLPHEIEKGYGPVEFLGDALNQAVETGSAGLIDRPDSTNEWANLVGGFAGTIPTVGLATMLGGPVGGIAAAGAIGGGTDIRDQLDQGRDINSINWLRTASNAAAGAGGQFLGGKFGQKLLQDALINAGVNMGQDAAVQGLETGKVDPLQVLGAGLTGVGGTVAGRGIGRLLQGKQGEGAPEPQAAIPKQKEPPLGMAELNKRQVAQGAARVDKAKVQMEVSARLAKPGEGVQAAPVTTGDKLSNRLAGKFEAAKAQENQAVKLSALKEIESRLIRRIKRTKGPQAKSRNELLGRVQKEIEYTKNPAKRQQAVNVAKPIKGLLPGETDQQTQIRKARELSQARRELASQRLNQTLPSSGKVIVPNEKIRVTLRKEPLKKSTTSPTARNEARFQANRKAILDLQNPQLVNKELGKLQGRIENDIRAGRNKAQALQHLEQVQKDRAAIRQQMKPAKMPEGGKSDANAKNQDVARSEGRASKAKGKTDNSKGSQQADKIRLRPDTTSDDLGPNRDASTPVPVPTKAGSPDAESRGSIQQIKASVEKATESPLRLESDTPGMSVRVAKPRKNSKTGEIETGVYVDQEPINGKQPKPIKMANVKAGEEYVKRAAEFKQARETAETLKAMRADSSPDSLARQAELLRPLMPSGSKKTLNTLLKAGQRDVMVDIDYLAEKVGISEGKDPLEKGTESIIGFGMNPITGDPLVYSIDVNGQLKTRLMPEGRLGFIERDGVLKLKSNADITSEYARVELTDTPSKYALVEQDSKQVVLNRETSEIVPQGKVQSTKFSEVFEALIAGKPLTLSERHMAQVEISKMAPMDVARLMAAAPRKQLTAIRKLIEGRIC